MRRRRINRRCQEPHRRRGHTEVYIQMGRQIVNQNPHNVNPRNIFAPIFHHLFDLLLCHFSFLVKEINFPGWPRRRCRLRRGHRRAHIRVG